jgi:cytochrome c553
MVFTPGVLTLATVIVSLAATGGAAAVPADEAARLLVARHCDECHTGKEAAQGLVLAGPKANESAAAFSDLKLLERIADRVRSHSMPPPDAAEPLADSDRESLLAWIDARIDQSVGDSTDPGTVVIRRLTRPEYRNTIRDLLGRDLPNADIDTTNFPSDDVAHGFDNLADVNSLSPLLMDRYADAACSLGAAWAKAVLARDAGAPADGAAARARAEAVLMPLADRAFRRPATPEERAAVMTHLDRLLAGGFDFEEAVGGAAARILAAPAFLYRIERDGPIGQDRRLDGHELATRLSYFLWSTMPDDELVALAAQEKLADDDAIRGQVRRMLADEKIRQGLVENFAGQWLQTRRLRAIRPDRAAFPDFDEPLRQAMERETLALVESVIRDDAPVTRLLDADYTFVNERLARHYGLAGVEGESFRRVSLADTPRRGLVGHAAVLAINAQPMRTSPVLRGKWILDVLLGAPPPPPPPGTSDLEAVGTEGTLRERMQRHRSAPQCSSCHAQMDALGLALENFDGIGQWRTAEGDQPIDASGTLPGGGSFTGPVELASLLRERHATAFRRSLVEKMLVYAIGRPLAVGDRRAVQEILAGMVASGDRFSSFVEGIALSAPFRLRRNPGRVGIDQVPEGLEALLDGNPEQQMILTLSKNAKAVAPFTAPEASVEVHSLTKLLAAATASGQRIDLSAPAGGPQEGTPWRQSLTLLVGKPVVLTFREGMIGPGESSDDFLKAVATVPPTDMPQVATIATSSHSWNAPLTGPDNVRPGSILSVEFDVTLVAKPRDTVQAWIATPGGTNDSMISNSGGFTVEGEGTHRLRQVGVRRPNTHDGWNNSYTFVVSTRPQTLVGNLSPIRVVRPRLGVSDAGPIRFAGLRPGQTAESDERSIANAQATTIDDQKGKPVASILYGCARMNVDPKFTYKVTTDNIGCEIVGDEAALFVLVGGHAAEDGRTLSFIGADGEPGLCGGPTGIAETEPFRVKFRGADEPGTYTAAVRIVTQAGNVGQASAGKPGEPMKGLFYVEIPIEAVVTETETDTQTAKEPKP